MSTPQQDPNHGLQMLQAASVALASSSSTPASTPPRSSPSTPPSAPPPPPSFLSTLLNPAPPGPDPVLPSGFVLGKDGKLKKKRGRKPTPGLTDEDRRQARLLKNRRTAETSRRRKLAMLNELTAERDEAKTVAEKLIKHNDYLTKRLAAALGKSVEQLIRDEPDVAMRDMPAKVPGSLVDQSDVSRAASCAGSDSDSRRHDR